MRTSSLRWTLFATFLFVGKLHAADLLVSNYAGDNVSRFSLSDGFPLGTLTGGTLDGTLGSRVGPDGKLYVTSEINNRVLRYNPTTGAYLDTFINGIGLSSPTGITFDSAGNALVSNFNDSSISKYSPTGAFLGTLVASGANGMNGPDVGTVVGPDGALYVPSFNSNSILKFNATTGASLGPFVAAGTGGLTQPRTILFRNGMVWVTSDSGNKVLRYGLDGHFIDTFVASGSGGLSGACGMVFGEDGFLYVSSWRNNRVLKYSETNGAYVGTLIASGLNGPTFLTVVPEPTTFAAIGLGLAGLARRRKRTHR